MSGKFLKQSSLIFLLSLSLLHGCGQNAVKTNPQENFSARTELKKLPEKPSPPEISSTFIPAPAEDTSTSPRRLLLIGGGTLVAVLLVAQLVSSISSFCRKFRISKVAATKTPTLIQKLQQQLNFPEKLEEIIKQKIIKVVKDDLSSSKGGSSLGSDIVQRVVNSGRLNEKISLLNPRLEQKIRNIIREELQGVGYLQGDAFGGTNPEVQVPHSDDFPNLQHEESSTPIQHLPPSLAHFVQEWCNFYNERQNQDSGLMAKKLKNVIELEETKESNDRRYRFSVGQDIELETVGRNQGSFWVIILEKNSPLGWLFPKLKITTAIHKVVQTLFEVEGDLFNYHYIEVIEPAQMITSDRQIWKLRKQGKIRLIS